MAEKEYDHEFEDLHSGFYGDEDERDSFVNLSEEDDDPDAAAADADIDAGDDAGVDLDAGDDADTDDIAAAGDDAFLAELLGDDGSEMDSIRGEMLERKAADAISSHVGKLKEELEGKDSEISKVKADLKKAKEDGETEQEVELNSKLTELMWDRRDLNTKIQGFSSDDYKKRYVGYLREQEKPSGKELARQALRKNPAQAKWLSRNKWYLKPSSEKHTAAREYVSQIEDKLIEKGLKPNDAKFYAEMDRQVAKRFPSLKGGKQERDVVPVDGHRGGSRRSTGNKHRISADEKRMMKQFGLDPSKPEDVKAYLKG